MKIRRSIVDGIKDLHVECKYILTILVMFKHLMGIPNPMPSDRNNEFLLHCLNKVKKAEYGFNVSDYKVLRESYANLVLLINKEYVFKFPKDSENSKRLKMEIKLLKVLSDSPVPIPRYIFTNQDCNEKFGSYVFFKGKPISERKSLSNIMLKQLVDFLNFLHKKEYSMLKGTGINFYTPLFWKIQFEDFMNNVRQNIFSVMDKELQKLIENEFEDFLQNTSAFEPSLVHGDLYKDNVLVLGNKISAIIDWGYASFGDPAIDIAAIAVDFPKEATKILESLDYKLDDDAYTRIEFYIRTEPLFEIMNGYLMNDSRLIRSGSERLEASLYRRFIV